MQLFNILKLIVVSLFVYLAIIQNGWAGLEDRKGIVEFQIRVINVTAFSGTIRCSVYIDAEQRQLDGKFVTESSEKSTVVKFFSTSKSRVCKIAIPFNWKGVDPERKMRASVYIYDYSCEYCEREDIFIHPDVPNFDFPAQSGKIVKYLQVDI